MKLRRSRIADAAVALKIEPYSLGARLVATIVGRISFLFVMGIRFPSFVVDITKLIDTENPEKEILESFRRGWTGAIKRRFTRLRTRGISGMRISSIEFRMRREGWKV